MCRTFSRRLSRAKLHPVPRRSSPNQLNFGLAGAGQTTVQLHRRMDPHAPAQYIQQWSASLEKSLGHQTTLEVGYLGARIAPAALAPDQQCASRARVSSSRGALIPRSASCGRTPSGFPTSPVTVVSIDASRSAPSTCSRTRRKAGMTRDTSTSGGATHTAQLPGQLHLGQGSEQCAGFPFADV